MLRFRASDVVVVEVSPPLPPLRYRGGERAYAFIAA